MGNGLVPGPTSDFGPPLVLDDGTSPRAESPAPGPIGLDATGNQSQASLAERILSFPRQHRGDRVGDGECFTLADRALRGAGARSAANYGSVTPQADYVWGTAVRLADLRPGDVVQFRGYRVVREIETTNADGSVTTTEEFEERPHHTAIVESVGASGEVTVLEQNAPPGSPVTAATLFFANRQDSGGGRSTKVRVHGRFWFYRPQIR